ncbi:MAG TPA: hypothetical protein VM821_04925, partial [Abditibacteriaceae bacterium]|nr:hypothetical protein [Abditibacteriaceae bacterium]
LEWSESIVATLLPLAVIIAPLTVLQVAASIMQAMAGLRDKGNFDPPSLVVNYLGGFAILTLLPLLIWHLKIVWEKRW